MANKPLTVSSSAKAHSLYSLSFTGKRSKQSSILLNFEVNILGKRCSPFVEMSCQSYQTANGCFVFLSFVLLWSVCKAQYLYYYWIPPACTATRVIPRSSFKTLFLPLLSASPWARTHEWQLLSSAWVYEPLIHHGTSNTIRIYHTPSCA